MIREITKLYIGKRVLATFIDYTIVWAFFIFYVYQFGEPNERGGYTVSGWSSLGPVLFWFVFIVLTEYYMGGTIGHQICKIRVVSVTNEKVDFWRTFKRRVVDFLEIALTFGVVAYLLARNTRYNQRLGDILAHTVVIGKDDVFKEFEFDFEKTATPV